MRNPKPHSYEIYADSAALNAPLTIVEDRFSLWAFLLHGLWLIYKGAWRVAIIWFVAFGGIAAIAGELATPMYVIAVLQTGMQLWLGLEASTVLAWDARLRGLSLQQVIVASNADEAELNYYRHHTTSAA